MLKKPVASSIEYIDYIERRYDNKIMTIEKNLKRKIILILLLPFGILLSRIFSFFPEFIEGVYSNGICKLTVQGLSLLTGIFPYSVAEIIIIFLVIISFKKIISVIYKIIKRKENVRYILLNSFINFLVFISITYFTFIIIWGLNYYRLSFAEIAEMDTRSASVNELETLCKKLIYKVNTLRNKVNENEKGVMDIKENTSKTLRRASIGYKRLGNIYPELSGMFGTPKKVLLSEVMSYMGISGIYFPFTGEANVNVHIPDSILPSAICHEMAHQRGFAREDEANYIAYLTCSIHPDVDFRYSGALLALIHSMNALHKHDREKFIKLTKTYSEKVRQDLKYINEYWKQYEGPIEEASSELNNAYLKSNMQRDGIYSYGRMVDLLIAEMRKKNNTQ